MATGAGGVGRRQIVVAVHVTLHALQRDVRSGQWEARRGMVEGRVAPGGRAMALLASLGQSSLDVIGICGCLEIFQVTTDARRVGRGQIVVTIHVALRTLDVDVRSSQRETCGGVIERRRRPVGRAMALLASLREARAHVVRVGGALEILQVAAHASRVRAGQVVIVIHMALHALHAGMGARQRESSRGVIEVRTVPRGGVVTLLAGLRETRSDVVRICGRLEVFQVAAHTRGYRQVVIVVDVALRALQGSMRAR